MSDYPWPSQKPAKWTQKPEASLRQIDLLAAHGRRATRASPCGLGSATNRHRLSHAPLRYARLGGWIGVHNATVVPYKPRISPMNAGSAALAEAPRSGMLDISGVTVQFGGLTALD